MQLKASYPASELVGLPGLNGKPLPKHEDNLHAKAEKAGIKWIETKGDGGPGGKRREYLLKSLWPETREYIEKQAMAALQTNLPAIAGDSNPPQSPLTLRGDKKVMKPEAKPAPNALNLKERQRECATARMHFIRLIEMAIATGWKVKPAMARLEEQAKAGILPPESMHMMKLANERRGKNRTLSASTLMKWWSVWQESDKINYAVLTPADTEKHEMPAWAPHFLKCYQVPQKISVPHALENLAKVGLPEGVPMPSVDQAYRFLEKMSATERERGRMLPRELKNIKPYIKRDTSGMMPGDCYIADGHTFDSWDIAHPATGKTFRPEITSIADVCSRKLVGFSVDLAESTWAVADALRNAVELNGIPAIFYHDKGKGYENEVMQGPVLGLLARLRITDAKSRAYNSQARGQIEKKHRDIWIRAAKMRPGYIGKDMDREAGQRVFKLLKKDIKETGTSRMLMPFFDFVKWLEAEAEAYNNRPHRSLRKKRDEATGKMRHMSPNEFEATFITQGWKPVMMSPEEVHDAFRPHKVVKVNRGQVTLFTNTYFAKELEHYHGEEVMVGYDIHDASKVWIKDGEGRFVCEALFEGNKRAYFPVSFIEQAKDRREDGRLKRLEVKIDAIKEERKGTKAIEAVPERVELTEEQFEKSEKVLVMAQKKTSRPANEYEAYELLQAEVNLSDNEKAWVSDYEFYLNTGKKRGMMLTGYSPFAERCRAATLSS